MPKEFPVGRQVCAYLGHVSGIGLFCANIFLAICEGEKGIIYFSLVH